VIRQRDAVPLLNSFGEWLDEQGRKAERSLPAQAIGRKNDMFVGSDRGGRTAATLYSLVGSYKRHQVDPFAYLKDILERLPTRSTDRLDELLPDAWIAANPDARRRVAS